MTLARDARETIRSLQGKIHALIGLPFTQQRLYQHTAESDEGTRLNRLEDLAELGGDAHPPDHMQLVLREGFDAHYSAQYTLRIAIPPPPNHVRMPAESVQQLKERLQVATGVHPSEQRLVVNEPAADMAKPDSIAPLDSSAVAPGSSVQLLSTPTAETIVVRLPPSLSASHGPTVHVAASPLETISHVKLHLERLLMVTPAAQELSFGGTHLVDESASLQAAGVIDTERGPRARGSTSGTNRVLDLAVRGQLPPQAAGTVHVAMPPPAAHVRIAVSRTSPVSELKRKWARATGCAASELDLLLDGDLLDETESLEVAGVANGDSLEAEATHPPTPPDLVRIALPRSMHTTFGPRLQVAISPNESVADLKASIHEITGVPLGMLSVALDGQALGEDDLLGAVGLSDEGSALKLTLSGAPSPPEVLVTVAAPWLRAPLPVLSRRRSSRAPAIQKRSTLAVVQEGADEHPIATNGSAAAEAAVEATPPALATLAKRSSSLPEHDEPADELDVDVRIATSGSASLGELKAAIQFAMGHEPINQHLKRDGEPLSDDDTQTLSSASVVDGDVVELRVVQPDTPPKLMAITLPPSLHDDFGPAVQVVVFPSDTVGDVKARVVAITGVPQRMMQPLTLGGAPLEDDEMLTAAGVLEAGSTLELTLSETPPPPPFVISVTPAFIEAATLVEQQLAAAGLEATTLIQLLRKHKQRMPPALVRQVNARLARIQAADAAMRRAIDSLLKLSAPLDASDHRAVLEANRGQSSRSAERRLSSLLASMEAADGGLRAALEAEPLSKAVLQAALDMHGDAASPRLCKEVEGRLQDMDEADAKIKRTIQAVVERKRLPAPPYEVKLHREVLLQYGPLATPSLCEMLEHQLDAMEVADAAVACAMDQPSSTVNGLVRELLAHGAKCSPSLQLAAKEKLAQLDPSNRTFQHVDQALDRQAQRKLKRHAVHTDKLDWSAAHKVDARSEWTPRHRHIDVVHHEKLRDYKVTTKVDDRSDWKPKHHHVDMVHHEKLKDFSKVQSRFRANNAWHGKASRKKLLAEGNANGLVNRAELAKARPPSISSEVLNPFARTAATPAEGTTSDATPALKRKKSSVFGYFFGA